MEYYGLCQNSRAVVPASAYWLVSEVSHSCGMSSSMCKLFAINVILFKCCAFSNAGNSYSVASFMLATTDLVKPVPSVRTYSYNNTMQSVGTVTFKFYSILSTLQIANVVASCHRSDGSEFAH